MNNLKYLLLIVMVLFSMLGFITFVFGQEYQDAGDENGVEYVEPTDLDKKVFWVFKDNCSQCHGENKQKGGLKITNGNELIQLPLQKRVLILSRTVDHELHGKKKMPLGGPTLEKSDLRLLLLWSIQEADRLEEIEG